MQLKIKEIIFIREKRNHFLKEKHFWFAD